MALADIQKAFIDGVEQIYSTMFTDGVNDGVELFYLDEDSTKVDSVYRESKVKKYKDPIMLVANAKLSFTDQEEYVMDKKYDAVFKVPYKSLMEHDCDVSKDGLKVMQRGKIDFHGVSYKIDEIKPTTFVENVFLIYEFCCTEV